MGLDRLPKAKWKHLADGALVVMPQALAVDLTGGTQAAVESLRGRVGGGLHHVGEEQAGPMSNLVWSRSSVGKTATTAWRRS